MIRFGATLFGLLVLVNGSIALAYDPIFPPPRTDPKPIPLRNLRTEKYMRTTPEGGIMFCTDEEYDRYLKERQAMARLIKINKTRFSEGERVMRKQADEKLRNYAIGFGVFVVVLVLRVVFGGRKA